jgi:hypothetical protein
MHEICTHRNRIEADCLLNGVGKVMTKEVRIERVTVHICHIGAQYQRWFVFAGKALENPGLTDTELNGIGVCRHESGDDGIHIFYSREEGRFPEQTVIDSDVESSSGFPVEKPIETKR